MHYLIIALFLIILAIMAIGLAIAAIPSWAAGMMIGGVALLRIYLTNIIKLTSREKLGEAVAFSVNGSRIEWHLQKSGDLKYGQLDPEIVFACLLGAAGAGCVGYFISYQRVHSEDKLLFLIATIVSALAVPWCIAKLKPRKIYDRWLLSRVSRVMEAFDSTLSGMDELREVEASIGSLAGQLRIAFPTDYVTEVERHVHSHQVELVFERAAFSQFMDTQLQSVRKDREGLEHGLSTIQEMEKLYLQTAREVNRTNSVSLLTESDWLGAGLKPENLPTLLSARKWDEFAQASAMMKDEMATLQERARKHGGAHADSEHIGAVPNRMTKAEALQILELSKGNGFTALEHARKTSEGAAFEVIKRAYKEAIKKFNVDQRQALEPHILKLVEEQYKEVNIAFDLLKAEFQATR